VQAAETLERGETPDLLSARGHRVVGEVERAHRVEVGLHPLQGSSKVVCSNSHVRTFVIRGKAVPVRGRG
jgi:hypothetical protein